MQQPWQRMIFRAGAIALTILNRFFYALVWFYSGLIGTWAVLRWIFADQIWWLGLVNALALYLFLPLAILLPLAVLHAVGSATLGKQLRSHPALGSAPKRTWWRSPLVALAIPLSIFSGFWGKQFIPPALKAPPQQGTTFEVMTFNTLFNNQDTAKIVDMLAETRPDILALQEIHPKNRDAVLAALGDYPYSVYHPNTDKHTIGLVSRFPILSAEPLVYPPLKRGLRVMLDINGEPLQVIVTHLTPNLIKRQSWPQYIEDTEEWFDQRDREMDLLTREIDSRSSPTLLLCDCNMTRTAQNYRDLSRHMTDGFHHTGWGLGWTVFHPAFSFPVVRFDYVWHTSELTVVRSYVGPDASSDHRPVGATVQFRHSHLAP